MGEYRTGIERVVVIGPARHRLARRSERDLYPVDVIPRFDPPSAGGFEHRRDRGRYLEHLEALRAVARGGASAALICESVVPPPGLVAQIDGALDRLDPGWTIMFADRRTGRWTTAGSPRMYVVSRAGAPQVLAHLRGVLSLPRQTGLGTDALSSAFESFVRRGESVSV